MAPPAREPNRAPAGTMRKIRGTTKAPVMNTAPPMKWASTPTRKASSASPVVLNTGSMMEYKRDMALEIRDAARNSIGSRMPAKSLELQHTIRLIRELDAEIEEIEEQIQSIMAELHSPITTIPGMGFRMAAMILAEVGDFTRFNSPDKLLAYAGMSPSTYQSGQLKNCYPHMEKRGSRYLRYALFNAAKYVCHWDASFAAYLAKKRAEGKHYNVAISHAAKKLVRLIFAMERSQKPYLPTS